MSIAQVSNFRITCRRSRSGLCGEWAEALHNIGTSSGQEQLKRPINAVEIYQRPRE